MRAGLRIVGPPLAALRRIPDRAVLAIGTALLVFSYVVGMLHNQARPGARALYPEGWWGWFDQGRYLRSLRAFAALDLRPSEHWYPLGYPLLGVPFASVLPRDPFLLVDLACLLASFAGFVTFARRCGIGAAGSVGAFLLGTVGSQSLRENWVIPWTTTPACAAIWLFLALCVRHLGAAADEPRAGRWRRLLLAGMLGSLIGLFRPSDLLLPAVAAVLLGAWALHDRTWRWADPPPLLLGAALPLVPYGLLYLRIYGAHPTPYMLNSRGMGFRFGELPMKTVLLLISPRPWFPSGSGLLMRLPWMAAGFAGMLLLPGLEPRTARRGLTLLTAMMLAYMALFFSYVDLLPSGLWTYKNVHYFKWVMPGFALLGVVLLRALRRRPRRAPILALLAVVLVSAVRLVPVPVTGGAVRLLQYAGRPPYWSNAYFGQARLADAHGVFDNILTMRILPDDQGLRVLSLSRPFEGRAIWLKQTGLNIRPDQVPRAWAEHVAIGWPCWLPPYACDHLRPIH